MAITGRGDAPFASAWLAKARRRGPISPLTQVVAPWDDDNAEVIAFRDWAGFQPPAAITYIGSTQVDGGATVNAPTGAGQGDLLVFLTNSASTLSGANEIAPNNGALYAWWCIHDGRSSYTIGTSTTRTGCSAFRGPSGMEIKSVGTSSAPSITTVSADLIVFFGYTGSATTATPPSGYTETIDVNVLGATYEIAYLIQSAAGSTGAQTATWASGTTQRCALAAFSTGPIPIGSTLASTLGAATASISGFVGDPVSASLSATLADTTAALSGALSLSGSLASTLGNTTASIAGGLKVSGSLSTTLDAATASMTGTVVDNAVSAALASTLADTTASLSASVRVSGAWSSTLANTTASLSGGLIVGSTLASTLADATASVSGSAIVGATLASTLAPTTLAMTGTSRVTGGLASTLDGATAALSGTVSGVNVTATLSSTLAPVIAGITAEVVGGVSPSVYRPGLRPRRR